MPNPKLEKLHAKIKAEKFFDFSQELVEERSSWPLVLRGSRSFLDFRSFDALGLYQNEALRDRIERACFSAQKLGFGPQTRRSSGGYSQELQVAERNLAKFFRTEDAILLSSKSQAILSVLSALLEEGDRILADEISLAPLDDIAFLMGAKIERKVLDHVQEDCMAAPSTGELLLASVLEYVEGVSLVTGKELVNVRAIQDRSTYAVVDETASLGLFGLQGAGQLEVIHGEVGLPENICIISELACFLRAPATVIAADSRLCDFVRAYSKNLQLECSISPLQAIAINETIEFLSVLSAEREALRAKTAFFRNEADKLENIKLITANSHVMSFYFQKFNLASTFYQALLGRGILVDFISSPGLRKEHFFVRIVISLQHEVEHVAKLLDAIFEIDGRISL
jgi:8-amino-7-oxononanoate synthase